MSSNPLASLIENLMGIIQLHLQELHLNPQQLLHNKHQMLAILQNCFSLTHDDEQGVVAVEQQEFSINKTHPTDRIRPSSAASGGTIVDSVLFKDSVAQSRAANNKSLIETVHAYLLQTGNNTEAEEYLKMVSSVSVLQSLESIKLWNYQTLPLKVFQGLEEMGLGKSPLRFGPPPHFFPVPDELGWKPGQPISRLGNTH